MPLSTLNKVHPTALGAPGDSISAEPTPTGAPEPIPATSQQIDIVVSAAADGGKLASPRLTGNEPAVKVPPGRLFPFIGYSQYTVKCIVVRLWHCVSTLQKFKYSLGRRLALTAVIEEQGNSREKRMPAESFTK